MGGTKTSWAAFSVAVARGVLQFRQSRRKLIFYTIVALLGLFAVGNWPLAGWLEEHPARFLLFWAACAFLAVFLFLLGLYDFLSVMKDYRDQRRRL